MRRLECDEVTEELVVFGVGQFGGVLRVVQLVRPIHLGRHLGVACRGVLRRERGRLFDQGWIDRRQGDTHGCEGTERTRDPLRYPARMSDDADARLLAAAATGDAAGIRAAIVAGANVNARDDDGRTGLLLATRARHPEAFQVLIDAEADVDLQDDRLDNPFLYAGAEGILDILKLANDAGADPAITNRYGGIALIPASERGHVETVRYLLEQTDVDVDHVNKLGWTALLEAILLSDGGPRHQAIVSMLIEAGADVDLADKDGVRPLTHARARGHMETAGLLVEAGATG